MPREFDRPEEKPNIDLSRQFGPHENMHFYLKPRFLELDGSGQMVTDLHPPYSYRADLREMGAEVRKKKRRKILGVAALTVAALSAVGPVVYWSTDHQSKEPSVSSTVKVDPPTTVFDIHGK
jgi:hypothetical protein